MAAWAVLLAVRDSGCFIFNWLDVRARAGPVQKRFTRKYREALHVNIRNGSPSFALPSQHHAFCVVVCHVTLARTGSTDDPRRPKVSAKMSEDIKAILDQTKVRTFEPILAIPNRNVFYQ